MGSMVMTLARLRPYLLALILCAFTLGGTAAATTLTGNYREARPGDVPAEVMREAYGSPVPMFNPSSMHVFPASADGTWVILRELPPWTTRNRVLSIRSPGLTPVTLYDEQGPVATTSLDDFGPSLHGHGRVIFDLPASIPESRPLLLKFGPSRQASGAATLSIDSWSDYLKDDGGWVVFATACFAVMITMALMAICFAVILRDMTFGWYAGYLVCYALIQGATTGFIFHPLEWTAMAGYGDALAAGATSLSVTFAALFMLRFTKVNDYAPLLRIPVLAFAIGMPVLIVLRATGVDLMVETARLLLQPFVLLGAALMLLTGAIAAARGSRYAWFFLIGWTPMLVLTALCGAQQEGMLADAPWMPDAAIAVGAFEAMVLSIGLSDRALTIRHDRDRARQLADSDPLTGLLNRRAWTDAALSRLEEGHARPTSLLFLDLDHFKELNDRYGHAAGDRALVAVAAALRDELRPSDLLGRFGGEEFVALLQGADKDNAVQVATRLCRRVHRLDLHIGEQNALLTVSIGVAMRTPADTLQSLTERADAAMYAAKLAGRNQVVCAGSTGPSLVRRAEAVRSR